MAPPVRPLRPHPGLLLALSLLALPACHVGYVLRSARFEAQMLAGREPIARVLEEGSLPPHQADLLGLVPSIQAWGAALGLSDRGSYGTVNPDWDHTILVFTACDPVSFTPVTWTFPVTGTVPYLGFFRPQDLERVRRRHVARGLDTWVRPAGAYSTLGWFRDPILPSMLEGGEQDLAEVLLHERAHATVWVRGATAFNEAFAVVVGEEGAVGWLASRHGEDSPLVARARSRLVDEGTWFALLDGVMADLEAVYGDPALGREEKLALKDGILATLPDRVASAPFTEPERFLGLARPDQWNNARLLEHRTYQADRGRVREALAARGGDLPGFIAAARRARRSDPFASLAVEP